MFLPAAVHKARSEQVHKLPAVPQRGTSRRQPQRLELVSVPEAVTVNLPLLAAAVSAGKSPCESRPDSSSLVPVHRCLTHCLHCWGRRLGSWLHERTAPYCLSPCSFFTGSSGSEKPVSKQLPNPTNLTANDWEVFAHPWPGGTL